MRRVDRALLLAGSVACAMWIGERAALAQGLDTPHVLDRVTVTGSKSVPTDKLNAALQERPGTSVVQTDIVADRDNIMKVLEDAHVTGSVDARITTTSKKHLIVQFVVHDNGIEAPTVVKVATKLRNEIFDGNKAVDTDKLQAAAGLTPGEALNTQKLADAQKAIGAVYAAAKLPLNVSVSGEPKTVSPGQVDIIWHIVETKGKKKRNTEDEREKLEQ